MITQIKEKNEISWKEAILKAMEELKYYFEIKDKKVFLEKVEPNNEWWVIMLSYYDEEKENNFGIKNLKLNSLFVGEQKQYINIYLDKNGNFLKLKKANAPE